MKKLLLLFMLSAFAFSMNAQIETPAPSPFQKIEQKVGLTDITVEYSRPSMKGRTIFGDLVPFDKKWRTGANMNTKITFGDDVMIGGKEIKAGSYAIYTTPKKDSWDIHLYSDSDNGGLPQKWDDSKVVATVNAEVYPLPMDIETFTISFDDLTMDGAMLGMMWEKSYVALPIKVMTDKMVASSIDRVMNGPSANDYYTAAVYYHDAGKDIDKAEKWMEKAMEMSETPRFWQLRQQSLIYAKAGKKDKAIETAKKSLAAAEAAGNSDYVKMNKDSLKEWGAM